MTLKLEIVTPRKVAYEADDISRVVLRRTEDHFDNGSEIVILPRHGQMMVRLPFHAIRVSSPHKELEIEIDGGFAEVHDDLVTILTREARVRPESPGPGCSATPSPGL